MYTVVVGNGVDVFAICDDVESCKKVVVGRAVMHLAMDIVLCQC